ncbi:MAG: hypothetical protein ACTSVZ_04525 [Promethearchaeota archaeon]
MKISTSIKLRDALDLLHSHLPTHILSYSYIPEQNQMRLNLTNGSRLYIIYNEADEYAYQLSFSYDPLDRIRFDSMDKNWSVQSSPHHFHPRYNKNGFDSPMMGVPSNDIPILIELIKSHNLEDKNLRF